MDECKLCGWPIGDTTHPAYAGCYDNLCTHPPEHRAESLALSKQIKEHLASGKHDWTPSPNEQNRHTCWCGSTGIRKLSGLIVASRATP